MPERTEEDNILEQFINFLFGRGDDGASAESANPLDRAAAGVGQEGAGIAPSPEAAPQAPIIIQMPAPKGLDQVGRSASADSTLEALASARSRLATRGAAPGSNRFSGTRANQAKQSGKASGRRNPELRDKAKIKKRRAARARKS